MREDLSPQLRELTHKVGICIFVLFRVQMLSDINLLLLGAVECLLCDLYYRLLFHKCHKLVWLGLGILEIIESHLHRLELS
jgi:hypothetical protein